MNEARQEAYSSAFLKRFYPLWRKVNFPRRHRCMIADAVDALGLTPSAQVLELACGTGDTTEMLAERIGPAGCILSTDVSLEMLKLAQQRAEAFPDRAVEFKQMDAAEMSFENEFDAVICVLGLSVIPQYEEAVVRAYRALRPGGNIAVLDAQLYKEFPFMLLNPFVKIFHRLFRAHERPLRTVLNRTFREVSYREYAGGSYFLYAGERPS